MSAQWSDRFNYLLIWGFTLACLILFCAIALYIVLLLPAEYNNRLPFTGTFVDRIIIMIAIIALIILFYIAWKRDEGGVVRRSSVTTPTLSAEEMAQRRREWNMMYYSRKGMTQGTRAERVAKINRNLNYILAINCIVLVVSITGWNFLKTAVWNNPYYQIAIIFASIVPLFIYDFWYSDEIRVLEDFFPDPSARLWLRMSSSNMDGPLMTAWIVVIFTLAVCLVVCSVFIPVTTPSGFFFINLFPATGCIVCLLARVK